METTREIAAKFIQLVSAGQFEKAQKEFFSPDVVSIEFPDAEGHCSEVSGMAAVTTKREEFQAIVESVQGLKTSAPLIQGDVFAFEFELDFTVKGVGPQRIAEICVYHVRNGKIFKEQFLN
jgi:hypothetical protein